VAVDAAARMLEEGKTTYLAQQKAKLGDIPDSKAERLVKSSPEWADYIKKMVNAKTVANKQRVELDYLKMRTWSGQAQSGQSLPVKREPKVGEYHEIMDPFLREWLAKKKVAA
jgi:hypothetical protein